MVSNGDRGHAGVVIASALPRATALPTTTTTDAAVRGGPRLLLRLEAAAALAATLAAYAAHGGGWGLFAALLLVPDLSLLAYLGSPRLGAWVYNAAHSHLGPALLAAVGLATGRPLALTLALVWFAHVALDRMLGYGLKYGTGFGHTHLGTLGHRAQPDVLASRR